jgi:membrane protein
VADNPHEGQPQPEPKRLDRLKARASSLREQGVERLEVERQRRRSVRLALDFYQRDSAFAGALLAGGLSVKFFLWFLPFALSVVVILGSIADNLDQQPEDLARDSGLATALAAIVGDAVDSSSQGRFYLGALGILLTIWAGNAVVKALRLVSRLAWQMEKPARVNPLAGSLAVVGFVTSILVFDRGIRLLMAGPVVTDLLAAIISVVGLVAILLLILRSLPHPAGIAWTHLLPGALLMTVGVMATRLVTAVYFAPRLESASALYGGLGMAGVFLAWLYILSRILVASISLNATLWQRRDQPADLEADSLAG